MGSGGHIAAERAAEWPVESRRSMACKSAPKPLLFWRVSVLSLGLELDGDQC